MINQKIALFILALSVGLSSWIYLGSDVKVEQVLTSREWQSNTSAYFSTTVQEEVLTEVDDTNKITVTSNVKYLPNGTYLRESIVSIYDNDNDMDENIRSLIHVSEVGQWELSSNYLLINPTEIKDSATNKSIDADVDLIKHLFTMDAQQSRRVDIINNKAILLTSLNYGSRILSSN